MERLEYRTTIDAPREEVWKILWDSETYPEWTKAFSEGSRAESDWKEGSKILFLNAENEGMIAIIEEKNEPEKMYFRHIGMIDKNGNEDYDSENVKAWKDASEIYTLEEQQGKTLLRVSLETEDSYKNYFNETWPKALDRIKELVNN